MVIDLRSSCLRPISEPQRREILRNWSKTTQWRALINSNYRKNVFKARPITYVLIFQRNLMKNWYTNYKISPYIAVNLDKYDPVKYE